MNNNFYRILLSMIVLLSLIGCKQAKYVQDGSYLLKENEVYFDSEKKGEKVYKEGHDVLGPAELQDLIQPTPNGGFKLFMYNRVDSTNYKNQLARKKAKYKKKNDKRQAKEDAINKKRIDKARKKGKTRYKKKYIADKKVRWGWRNWIVTKLGEEPVLLDTFKVRKSKEQMEIYLKKRGFYNAEVRDTVIYKENKKKARVQYYIDTGDPYVINKIEFDSTSRNINTGLVRMYARMVRKEGTNLHVGDNLDEDVLDAERTKFANYCADNAYYSINKNYINFVVDTTVGDHKANVTLVIKNRVVPDPNNPDTTIVLNHTTFRVNKVTFVLHNPDTMSFKYGYEAFKDRCDANGLPYKTVGKYSLLDTLHFIDTNINTIYMHFDKKIREERGVGMFEKYTDTVIRDKGYYIYNDEPFLNPELLDRQNFLENGHWYKSYYVDRTYSTMLGLDVFSGITPIIEVDPENPLGNQVNVTYHLVPAKRQTFVLEPRITNSNSILGVSAAVSYTNKNLKKGAQSMKVSFVGGFESQPLIVGEDQQKIRKLNTFEWGPTLSLKFPKLLPLPAKTQRKLSKRLYPSTTFDLSVNFQNRVEFNRRMASFFYTWNFKSDKTQEWKLTLLGFNFVKLDLEPDFVIKLNELNDPFILNSYADHNSTLFQLEWHFNNSRLAGKFGDKHDIKIALVESGWVINSGLGAVGVWDPNASLKPIFGVPFTQFIKIDNQYIYNHTFNRKSKLAMRFLAGIGYAYKNSPSLPYEQSFFGGGSNDIRAFAAKTMAPGSTWIYSDSTATTTQIGDMRLELNLEYRFKMTSILEGAFFLDVGNIWNVRNTAGVDPLSLFHFNTFWKQVAMGVGYGLRADLDFLILRLDMSFAIHNPYLPEGEKWVGSRLTDYRASLDIDGNGKLGDYADLDWVKPYPLTFSVGIGYPF